MFEADEIGLSCNSNDVCSSMSSSVFVGYDLLGNPIYEKVVRWHLLGFIVRTVILWHDKAVFHTIKGSDLQLVERRFSNGEGAPDLFDVSSKTVFSSQEQKRLALSDDLGLCHKLSDF
jgi:hypothetical protein